MDSILVRNYAESAKLRYIQCKSGFEKSCLLEQIQDTILGTGKPEIWKKVFSDIIEFENK